MTIKKTKKKIKILKYFHEDIEIILRASDVEVGKQQGFA